MRKWAIVRLSELPWTSRLPLYCVERSTIVRMQALTWSFPRRGGGVQELSRMGDDGLQLPSTLDVQRGENSPVVRLRSSNAQVGTSVEAEDHRRSTSGFYKWQTHDWSLSRVAWRERAKRRGAKSLSISAPLRDCRIVWASPRFGVDYISRQDCAKLLFLRYSRLSLQGYDCCSV